MASLHDGTDRSRASALASLRLLIRALTRSARTVETRTGLTNAQLFLLRELAAEPALSVNQLALRARTTQGTVSSLLSRLEEAGLVNRGRSLRDARRAELVLTPAARRLLRKAPAPPTAELLTALRRLSDAEARSLSRGLRALVRRLGLRGEVAPMLFENGAAPLRRAR